MKILERLPRESGREFALRTIKDNIIHLELAPGSPISENELAAAMGLSRTPVREALSELSRAKVVEICPQKKSVVSLIDYDLVEEASFLRNLLECAVVELDCRMAGEDDIAGLRESVRLQDFYLRERRSEKLWELDNLFHQSLFEIARKPQAFALLQGISIHFDRVRNMALHTGKDLKDLNTVQDHQDITEAIARRDAAAARQLMETHLNRYRIDAAVIQEKYPAYFRRQA